MFVLETLESYAHSLIQSTTPTLLLVEDSSKEKVLDKFLISIDFCGCSLRKGVHGSETNGIYDLYPKNASNMINSHFLSMNI